MTRFGYQPTDVSGAIEMRGQRASCHWNGAVAGSVLVLTIQRHGKRERCTLGGRSGT